METLSQTQKRNPIHPFRRTGTIVACLLAAFFTTGAVFAVDRPPQGSGPQRAWLAGHLITDMLALGAFDADTLVKVPAIVDNLTDDQVRFGAILLPHPQQDRTGRLPLCHATAGLQRGAGQRGEGGDRRPADGDERPDRGVLQPVRRDARCGRRRRPSLLRQRAGLVLPCPLLRSRLVLRQRLLRRSLL